MRKPAKGAVIDLPASVTSAPLGQTSDLFQLLVDNIRDYAIILLDPKGTVLTWNTGAERLKGWKAGEIIGQNFSRFYPPEDLAKGKTEMELENALEQGRFEDEGWRVRKDGSRFWANVIITPLLDKQGELRGYGKVTRDLTERRKGEDKVRKNRMNNSNISVIRVRDLLMVTMPADPDDPTISALQDKVLTAMEQHEAKGVVLDISSVETLDSFFARTVAETAQMVELMGGRTIIAGMRPAVAVTATQIGLTFGKIETALNVDRALDLVANKPMPDQQP